MRMLSFAALALGVSALPPVARAEPSPSQEAARATPANAVIGPALYVGDMQRSLKFYRDVLGTTVWMEFGPSDRPDVVIGYGADPSSAGLMLLSDRAGAVPRKVEHAHGYDRFALRVANLPGVRTKLREAGYATSDIREVHGTHLMMMATDPDGYKVELIDSRPIG